MNIETIHQPEKNSSITIKEKVQERQEEMIEFAMLGIEKMTSDKYRIMPENFMTKATYKDKENYDKAINNKLRKNWFTAMLYYSSIILDSIKDKISQDKYLKYDQSLKSLTDEIRKADLTNEDMVRKAEKIALNIKSIKKEHF